MVPFGGTKVGAGELAEALELEEARQAARDSGRTAARVEHPGSWDCEISVGQEGTIHVLPVRRREVRIFRAPGAEAYHAWPVSVTTVLYDPDGSFEGQLAEERAAGFGRGPESFSGWADRLPESGRESGPSPEGAAATGRSFLDAERGGEAVIGTYGRGIPNPSRSPRQRAAARRRFGGIVARAEAEARTEARAKVRRAAQARKTAWDAALSIHLASLPAADRLELFLQLGGRRQFAALEHSAKDPKGLKLAARELAEAGRIKVRRGLSSGKVVLEASEDLDRKGLEKELLKVMALAEPGEIEVPKGTRLARRVAATKAALTRARARESTSTKATEAEAPVRVAA